MRSPNSYINSCKYCAYWKGKKIGCVYENGCCCPEPQKPTKRNGIAQVYPADSPNEVLTSECEDCPYGRDSPCLGWCTKNVMRSVGLLKSQ